jgi:hypothetical protein
MTHDQIFSRHPLMGWSGRKVLSADGCDVRRVWAEETAQGTRVIGEYSDKNVVRRHMLLALERFRPSLERKKA